MDTILGAAVLMLLLLLDTAILKPAVGWQLGLAFSAFSANPTYRCVLRPTEWRYMNAVFPATATGALFLSCSAPSRLLRRVILPCRISALPEFARPCFD